MTNIFHETKRERKFYEDKKQKALRYIKHTIALFDDRRDSKDYWSSGFLTKLHNIEKLVNDI
jgi:hypothetical protein